ncbi:MAG: hypothetical protein IKP77_06240 [Acholeplasmatales bacterium]|nr:hypothetical protein [Acholeplasmatales bacterium]
MKKTYHVLMIILCLLYAFVVALYIATKSEVCLAIWEIYTILSAIYFLIYFRLLSKYLGFKEKEIKIVTIMFIGLLVFTSIAHISSVCITRPLLRGGYDVPKYYLIGMYPSIEMFIDYIGWGLFTGLGFIFISKYIKDNKLLKNIFLVLGIMILIGFVGGFTPIQELWYIASFGYGFGPVIISIILLVKKNN